MKRGLPTLVYPELIFGIAGPIGIDIDAVTKSIAEVLFSVGYRSQSIRITDEIADLASSAVKPKTASFYNTMRYKMAHASAICRAQDDPSYLMKLAVRAIRREREVFLESKTDLYNQDDLEESVNAQIVLEHDETPFHHMLADEEAVAFRSAYIIRQIKRPAEVNLLRNIYGQQFVLISASGSEDERIKVLREKIRQDNNLRLNTSREVFLANKLVELDMSEDDDDYGQRTRDAFHLADVVIEGINKPQIVADLQRFINALFGLNEIAPSRAESECLQLLMLRSNRLIYRAKLVQRYSPRLETLLLKGATKFQKHSAEITGPEKLLISET